MSNHTPYNLEKTVKNIFEAREIGIPTWFYSAPKEAKWKHLLNAYPEIRDFYFELLGEMAKINRERGYCCAVTLWYGFRDGGSFKRRFTELVGHGSIHPELRSSWMYDRVYELLFESLPDCRKDREGCL